MITCILFATLSFADDSAEALKNAESLEDWDVNAAHGPTHTVHLDLNEGTWMNVTVRENSLVFDLLGDLWTLPLAGGEATRLTEGAAWDGQASFSPDGERIAYVSDRGGNEQIWVMNADGTDAQQVTEEDVARVTWPAWEANGDWLLARRRTVDTRSIGVTELWSYSLHGGSGIARTQFDAHPHAGEPTFNDDYLWFSSRYGRFDYNENPASGLWRIERMDRRTGDSLPVAHGPGSASHPMLTPDGQSLVFVSRDRTQTLLERLDLETGTRTVLADWLSPDALEGFALHGTYPRMDWTEDGDLVLWAQGKLWRMSLDGERTEIPFHLQGDWTMHDVARPTIDIADASTAKVVRWSSKSARGAIAFSALASVYVRTEDGETTRISQGTGYAPRWSPNGEDLLYTSWSDTDGGRLHFVPGRGRAQELPIRGQMVNPAFGPDGQVVVLRGVAGSTSPDLGSEPWYEVVLLTPEKKGWIKKVVTSIHNRGPRAPRLHLRDGRIWWMDDRWDVPRSPSSSTLVSVNLDGTDKRDHLSLGGAEEASLSPDFTHIAYKLNHQLHVAQLPAMGPLVAVDGGEVPSVSVTKVVGDWLGWSEDGAEVTWMAGNTFNALALEGLFDKEDDDDDDDEDTADADADADEDADAFAEREGVVSTALQIAYDRARPTAVVAYTHARVISMNGDEVLEDATIVVDGDRIASVNGEIPQDAEVVDLTGKTIIPGLVDVHAHLHFSSADVLPEQEWRYQTALDFGVTTVQDPSAHTDLVFTQAELVESGAMVGPRVYSTGGVLYGALSNAGAQTPDEDAARGHVRRMKAVGAHSVKVYQQSQRERRQWYVQACVEEDVLCVPEGGGDLWMNLGMIADGFHAIEHSLPVTPIYNDILGFWAGSHTDDTLGTFYTQTLVVAYGGISGENYFMQHSNPLNNERLLRHHPRRVLDAKLWRPTLMAQDEDWRFQRTAAMGAILQEEGVKVTLGGHGQLQGMGVHWELWGLAGPDAMSPHNALRAATIDGALYMGLQEQLGSIEAGKLADFVVLNSNPLDDIRNSVDIERVVKNGESFE